MLDLIIKNGKVVSPDLTVETDIGIKDGKIVILGLSSEMPQAKKVVDAQGKYVIPGGIDPHVHFDTTFTEMSTNHDFYTGTRACAIGGTTMIIDFAEQTKGNLPIVGAKKRYEHALNKCAIDYAFHMIMVDITPEAVANIKEVIDFGIPTFKGFMVYDGMMTDDADMLEIMKECKKHNAMFVAHAENNAMIKHNIQKALDEGHHEPIWHAWTKTPITESEAIHRALYLTKYSGVSYYNVHMAVKEGVEMFARAREEGQPAYAETCTQYLAATLDLMKRADGYNFICSPPLRDQENVEGLWKGIQEGHILTIGSDDCSFDAKKKLGRGNSFEKIPNGLAGAEFRVPIVFSEGVSKGRISVNQFVAITSTNAAKIHGLYPQKGIIALGSDADIVILDPELEKTITMEDVQVDLEVSAYEGLSVKGWPVVTVSKGKVIVENGEFKGEAGAGQFLKRTLAEGINERRVV